MTRIYSERGSSEREKEIFAANLNYYIEQSDKTQVQVAKDLGFNPTTLNMWCKGNSMPTSGKIQKIADYFQIGKSDLTEDVPAESMLKITVSNNEKYIIEKYRSSDDLTQKMVLRTLGLDENISKNENEQQ